MNKLPKLLLLLVGVLVIGCVQVTPTAQSSPTPEEILSTATRTSLPKASPIAFPQPSSTLTATQTPTAPPTVTSTATPTPTLSWEEVKALVSHLFQTNGDCTVPCFWGIVPGETSLQDADQVFRMTWRDKGFTRADNNGNVYHYDNSAVDKGDKLKMTIQLDIENDIVEHIQVYLGGFFQPEVSPEDWAAYSLPEMLRAYGIPTAVYLGVDYPHEETSPQDRVFYVYILYWEAADTMILYSPSRSIPDRSPYRLCPLHPDQEPAYLNLMMGKNLQTEFAGWKDLAEITDLSTEDFYDMFVNNPDENTCLDVDAEYFRSSDP